MDTGNDCWVYVADSGQLYSCNFQSLTNKTTPRIFFFFCHGGMAYTVADAARQNLGGAVKVMTNDFCPWSQYNQNSVGLFELTALNFYLCLLVIQNNDFKISSGH